MKKLKNIITAILLLVSIVAISTNVRATDSVLESIADTNTIDEAVLNTGVYMEFVATFKSELASDTTIPNLQIKIGNGNTITVSSYYNSERTS